MRLMFVGDISLGEHFFSFGHGPRSLAEKGRPLFGGVKEVLAEADFVIGNLEGPLSDIEHDSSCPLKRVFRGAPASVDQLKSGGINVLNLANNHSLQHGEACFLDTIEKIHSAGLKTVGLASGGRNGKGSILVGRDGEKIGVVAASAVPDNQFPEQNLYNSLNVNWLRNEVQSLSKKTSAVVVILHWGIEGNVNADDGQKRLARDLIKWGAKIVVGHHPHVLFEIEQVKNGLIAYSMGNFVFDLPWDKRLMSSGILDIHVSPNGDIASASLWPVELNRSGFPFLSGAIVPLGNVSRHTFNHSKRLRFQALRKILYLTIYLPKGDTFTKVRFLIWKIKSRFSFLR